MPKAPPKATKWSITSAEELRELLKNKKITLDCGHRFCLHPFSNTMIILANGQTQCHE